ncbi:hypothetical protein ACFOGG_02330 [Brenneria rubrifaciens]|uniref:hypothetical protein n=1 Tax=Brenneria rubrifaciens TaxID=55213 RepID=UPI00360E203D
MQTSANLRTFGTNASPDRHAGTPELHRFIPLIFLSAAWQTPLSSRRFQPWPAVHRTDRHRP